MVMMPLASAAPPAGGETTTSNGDETWSEEGTMNGHHTVLNGTSLTVSANITMETGSSITVEQGGELRIMNGALLNEDLNAGLLIGPGYSTISMNFGDVADEGVVQLKFDHEIIEGRHLLITHENQTINASGSDMVQFDVSLNGTELAFTFESGGFTSAMGSYVLWAKAIYNGGTSQTIKAEQIETLNAPLYWFQSAFDVIVEGSMDLSQAHVYGANISCPGSCIVSGSTLTGSAPIDVPATGSLDVLNSILSGSRSDEDIILHDDASISYLNSQGTGGSTDAWIRLLSQRVLTTNIPNGSLDIYDLGYAEADWNDLTDENGEIVLVDGKGSTEHKRIVEWMDGNGNLGEDNGTITLSITSNWGVFSTTFDAPRVPFATVEVPFPLIEVVSLEPENVGAEVNRSLGLMMTVTNTGDVAATPNFRCYVGEYDADTAPSTIMASLEAGETKTIPITWYMYEAVNVGLTCKPFIPLALNDVASTVTDANGVTSEPVTWSYGDEIPDKPLVIWAIAVGIFGGGALWVSKISKAKQYDHITEFTDGREDPTESE